MGITFQEGDATLGSHGRRAQVQIKFDDATGLQSQADGTWALVGDPYYSHSGLKKYYGSSGSSRFLADLSTSYGIEETKDVLEMQGFDCQDNQQAQTGRDGLIRQLYVRC